MSWRVAVVASLVLGAPAAQAAAQVSSITQDRDLNFGTVWAGSTRTIAATDAAAAQWTINTSRGTNMTLSFTLPGALTSGANSVALTYGSSAAQHDRDSNPSGGTSFNPAVGTTASTTNGQSTLWVWLGGSISPGSQVPAGTYTATITLVVTAN